MMLQITEALLISSPIRNRPHSSQRPTKKVSTMPFFKSLGRVIRCQARVHSKDSAPQKNNRAPTPANLEDPAEHPSQNSPDMPGLRYEEFDRNKLHLPTENPPTPAIRLEPFKSFTPPTHTPNPAPAPTIPFNNGFLHPGSYIFTDLATTGTKGKGKTVLPPPRPRPEWPVCQSKNCPLHFAHEAGPYNFDLEGGNNGLPTPPDVVLQAMLDTKLKYDLEKNAALVIQFKLVHAWPNC